MGLDCDTLPQLLAACVYLHPCVFVFNDHGIRSDVYGCFCTSDLALATDSRAATHRSLWFYGRTDTLGPLFGIMMLLPQSGSMRFCASIHGCFALETTRFADGTFVAGKNI